MKNKLALSFVALLGVALVAQPAAASKSSLGSPGEFSSAAKKKVVVVREEPVLVRRRGFADPSFDEYGRLYRPPPHLAACAMDLGYGRWVSCNTGR